MMLPEMTSSARVARAFPRFARGAVAGLALGVLAGCGGGGGGSSTPAKKTPAPEMTITPPAPTAEDIASATDITGQDSFEVRLDSANPRAFYKIRVDEPTVLALRGEDGLEVTVYDSAGNVVNPSTAGQAAVVPSAASAGGGGYAEVSEALTAGGLLYYILGAAGGAAAAGGTFVITVVLPAAALTAVTAAVVYTVYVGTTALALKLRSPRALDRGNVEVGLNEEETSVEFEDSFEGESLASATFSITPEIRTRLGTWNPKVVAFEGKQVVRLSRLRSENCPAGTETTAEVKLVFTAEWTQSIPIVGEIVSGLINRKFEATWTLNAASAPRRKAGSPNAIAVTVPEGGAETLVLTDFIEDPQGGALTFERSPTSVPGRWSSALAGPRLTFTAGTTGGASTVTITATDPAKECWNFPSTVTVEGEEEPGGVGVPVAPSPETPQGEGEPEPIAFSCTATGSFTGPSCREFPSGYSGAGGFFCRSEQRPSQQCSRTDEGAYAISSCRLRDGVTVISYHRVRNLTFFHVPSSDYSKDVEGLLAYERDICEQVGGTFTVHKGS